MAASDLLSSLLLVLWSASVSCTDDNMTTTSATSSPIELCLDVTALTISNASLPFALDQYADMQGIVYAYAPSDNAHNNTRSHTFDIAADDNSTAADHASATVPMSVGRIGCWTEPLFHALSLNLKVNDFYHTSLKAECNVETPPISEGSSSDSVTMHTAASYEFGRAVVDVEYTWVWQRRQDVPAQDKTAVADGLAMEDVDVAVAALSDAGDHEAREKKQTDWMFAAAVTSAILGAVVLCGVCVQQRLFTSAKGYEFIPTAGHGREKLASIKRISLSVGRARDEQKPIMNAHPPCSYTF